MQSDNRQHHPDAPASECNANVCGVYNLPPQAPWPCRYRAKRKEREAAAEQAVHELSERMAELEAHNRELDARERLMTQLVQAQEIHIDRLSANQVLCCPLLCL